MTTLAQRAALRDGVMPISAGVMIETRIAQGTSLFLRVWEYYSGTMYEISHGIDRKRRLLMHFVPLAPWRKKYIGGKGWTLA